MDYTLEPYIVYVQTDEQGRITAVNSSAFVSTGEGASLYSALEDSFQPGCVNTDLWKFYVTSGYKRENAALSGGDPSQYRINEVPWDKYTDALKSTFASYGDAALVVLSRSSGEGADLPSGLTELEPYMTDGDYLRLCKEEKDLLEKLLKNGKAPWKKWED